MTRISDMVYQIQQDPTAGMMVLHLNRLVPYLKAAHDEQP
jgi:hypothetical protein